MTHQYKKINNKVAAQIAIKPTALVAMEQNFPTSQRIIHDDFAKKIIPGSYRFFTKLMRKPKIRDKIVASLERRAPGLWGGMMCRKRYIDDKLLSYLTTKGSIGAVVNLGAGYDTRAYRLPDLKNVPVWEVDLPANIAAKQKVLNKIIVNIPSNVKLVSVDFNQEELGQVLESKGFDINTKTFYIWEAVTQYLTEVGVRKTFDFLTRAPKGSRLVFTYVRKDFIEGKNQYKQELLYKEIIIKRRSWHFGFDPEKVTEFLNEYGWCIVDHLGYDDLDELYVKPTGRKLSVMAIERMVYAEKL